MAPEDAPRNESTHSRACTLNCRCTTQAHMINVSGKPMALDRWVFYQEIMTFNKKSVSHYSHSDSSNKNSVFFFCKTDP